MTGEERSAESKGCFFCEVAQKPENVIFENELFYAQFDKFPVTPGHAEIIPKKHIDSLLDLKPEEWASLKIAITETVHLIDSLDLREVYTKFLETRSTKNPHGSVNKCLSIRE
jgi:galactose-1-phosphate uridylyltransferase